MAFLFFRAGLTIAKDYHFASFLLHYFRLVRISSESMKKNGKKAMLIRVDKDLHAKLKARAKSERRSLQASVEIILMQASIPKP